LTEFVDAELDAAGERDVADLLTDAGLDAVVDAVDDVELPATAESVCCEARRPLGWRSAMIAITRTTTPRTARR
jgi:hypothetical protein